MKTKRLLAGLMSLAMLCSVASTPIYALEESVEVANAPTQSEPVPEEQAPAEESPAPEATPVAEESAAPEETPVPEATPVPEEPAAPEATPVAEETPAPEATPVAEEPAAPEAAPVAEETPAPTATPVPTAEATEETMSRAPANQALAAPRSGEDNASFADVVEDYYGDDAENPLPVGNVTLQWSSASTSGDELRAGNTVSMVIDFVLNAAATYNYTSYEQPLFDSYDDTTITLTLPEHVTIDTDEAGTLDNVTGIEDLGNQTWKLTLTETLPADSSFMGTLLLPLLVEGNGVLPVGTLLDFSGCTVTMDTAFTIMDRTNPAAETPYKTFGKTITGTNNLTDKTLVTDDRWGIQKTPGRAEDDASGAVTVSEDKSTVTASFFLKVGLLTDDVVNPNNATYGRPGRVPLEGDLLLTETPTVLDRQGNPLQPKSITVTPQFGEGTPLTFTAGEPQALPLRTCSDSTAPLPDVDGNAPYVSTYLVEVVYDYDPFVAHYYEENQDLLTILNTASITYQLKGENTTRTHESKAQVEAGEVVSPAALHLEKYLLNAENTATLYSAADDVIRGPAQFTLTDADDPDAPVTLYARSEDGTYQRLEGNTVTIDPQGSGAANGTDGTLTIYLDPGRYTVTETALPDNTVAIAAAEGDQGKNSDPKTLTLVQGAQQTAAFYNREDAGMLLLTKQGPNAQGENVALAGAGFALYADADCTRQVAAGTTDANGQLRFDRLAYGTYYLKETAAPAGYALSAQVETITLSREAPLVRKTVLDNRNLAYAKLEKQRQEGADFAPITGSLASQLNGAFAVQQLVDGEWQDVTGQTGLSLNGTTGQLVVELPVYDAENQPITYRFHETLPTGWHDPDNPDATEAATDGFTLVDNLGQTAAQVTPVVLRNERDTGLVIHKTFYGMTETGLQPLADGSYEATFRLYSRVGTEGAVTPYRAAETFMTENGTLSIDDLPRTDAADTPVQYFLEEVPMTADTAVLGGTPDFVLVDEQTGSNTAAENQTTVTLQNGTSVTVFGPFDFDAMPTQTIELRNDEDAGGLLIRKQDATTGAFVPGAGYEVTDGTDKATGTVEDADGTFVKVKAGRSYTVTESVVPEGYHPYYGEEASATGWESGTVDKGEVVTVVMENLPDPTLTVEKEIRNWTGEEGATTQDGVEFTVYEYDPETETLGDQVMVKEGDQDVPLKVTSGGEPVHLAPGSYVLKEISAPDGALDPNTHMDQYANVEDTIQLVNGPPKKELFFGPVTLSAVTKDGDEWKTGTTFRAINLSENGALRVKKEDENGNPLAGAIFITYRFDDTQEEIEMGRATTDTQGLATFTDLPIYDEHGSQIFYYVREIQAPPGYSISKEEPHITLNAGTVTELENSFVNVPSGSFTVTKVYYNLWEHSFTQKEYLLPGTRVALFAQDGETYKFRELATADDLGQVRFTDLRQDTVYVAVEYDIPAEADYAYLQPQQGGYLSEETGFGDPTKLEGTSLTETQLERLNYVTYNAKDGDKQGQKDQTAKLINEEHWTQLHIKKYVPDANYTAPEVPANSQADGERPINNAEFDLYMQVVDEELIQNGETVGLTYVDGSADYTHIGHYSSGTLYDPATGDRMDGWFGTDVLKAADNVVYWLVERTPGIGAAIQPESQIVLIYPSGQKYSNQSKSLENPDVDCTNTYAYTRDTVNRGLKVENDPVTGPGTERFATVRLTKWADSYDEDGALQQDYTPLGNATFAIYLAHADGTTAALLDTVTTGLDNTDLTGGDLTAWASSYAFGYNALMNAYGDLDEGDGTPEGGDIFWTDADGNAYARLILRETSAPAGYSTPDHEFRMTLFFQKVADGEEASETFNDLFYVKTDNTKVPLASTIGDGWPCYAVDADGNRLTQDDTQYRLVNLPIDNFAVTVTKYGYTVHEENIPYGIQSNLNMTAEQLDAYYDAGTNGDDRVPLQVTMRIQRYNGTSKTWADYVYTHADGTNSATFTTTDGWYAFPNGLPVGRYRLIETAGATGYIRMYDGSAVAGDAFHNVKAYYFAVTTENLNLSLYNPRKLSLTVAKTDTNDQVLEGATFRLNNLEATTDDSGYAEFENLDSGVYTLQETGAASGYSKAYLAAYLKDAYPRSKGYVCTVDANTSYALEDFATSGIYLGLQTVQQGDEPVVTNKVDLNDYQMQDPLMLTVQDPALGSLTITKTDAQKSGVTLAGATFTLAYKPFSTWSKAEAAEFTDDGSGWTVKVAETDQTGEGGTVTVQNLEPGIYKITEKTAPDGYTADTNPRYAIVAGGLTQKLTWNGQTLNDQATVSDKEKVDLTVTKRLDTGSVPLQQDETFTFTLYSGTTELDSQTVTFAKGTADDATQQVTFEDLEQGGNYTLTETHHNGFVLTGITDAAGNPLTVTQDAQGNSSVSLTMPTDGTGLTVTATNRALQGSITLQKQDGSNGTALAGATFTITRTGTPAMEPITVTTDAAGSATAVVPLTGVEGNEFTITETAAPDGYVRKDNTVTLTVKPGDAASPATNEALTVKNYPGVKVQLTKYDNAREGLDPLPQAEVTFALYRQDGTAWTFVEEATTDENGVLTFTVEDGQVYAVAENPIPAGYQGLEGLWDGTGWVPTARDETRTYYLINGGEPLVLSQGIYAYDAHNVPYIRLELRKQDALHPAAETQPEATVDLYEVPADTPTTLTEEQVSALLARTDVTRVAQGVAVNLDGSDTTANSRFKYGWLDNTVVGGKTYLALETDATMTQIRDHADEVWYAVFTVPADTTGLEVVTLKNVPGRAELKLEKTTETAHYESLLAAPAQLRYTLTPTVEDNTYPLNGFVLADTGLTAYHQDTPLDFATYLQDKYAITQVTLAPSSHDGAAYSADGRQTGLQATVTFYDFAGNAVESQTVEDATRTATLTPASNSRIARVEVSYRSPALQEATGYVLGQNFRPGAVTVQMTLDQQPGGVDVQEITRVVNTATATLTYNPWDGQGTKLAEETLTKEAAAENTFAELKGALISVNKTVDKDHPTQNDTLTYTIAVHNAPEAEAAMQRPFVVDLLPQGTRLEGESGNVTLIDPPAGVEIENIRISTQNGETALFVFLTGELAPGATLQLQLQVHTTAEIAVYGPEIRNYVLAGSRVAGVKSVNNPHGSSYKTADNLWPYGLDTVLSSLAGTQRLESLRAMLGEMKDFGYVSAVVYSNWSATSAAGLVKTGQGNLSTDLGFTSDRLSTVGNDGYMDYRLQVSNLSSADQNVHFTNVTVLDVFPFVGDRSQGGSNRGSQWEMTFATDTYAAAGNPTGVQLQRLDENGNAQILGTDQYEVFYYTGDITRDNINDVYACVEQIRFGQDAPAGWDKTPTQGATAIAIAVEKRDRSALASHGSYLAEYRLRVGNLSQEDLADRSWTNAVNNFIFTYDRYVGNQTAADAVPSNTTMLSNSVSNTILPSLVQVGGHVWIDKNADGEWQADESVDALAGNALVQSLLNHAEVTLYTYEGNSDVVRQAQSYATGSDPDWYSEANFLFTGLEPASRMDNFTEDQLYSSGDNRDPLNPALLKGEAPKTYRILVTVPETAGILNRVTTLGGMAQRSPTGYSRHPDDLAPGGAHADEASDNNFFAVDGTSARNNISERFFLYATADPATQFDNTKDIGFVLQRNLILQKVAKNDPTKTLEGATFRIYGPFATVEAANTAALTDENVVAEVTTDANGRATVPNLNWFQNYVIVETDSADYYQLDGATAANADGVLQAYTGTAAPGPAWVLGVPADNVTNQNQTVTVTNRTEVEYTLTAAKTMEGTTLRDNQFTFTLLDGQMRPLQTARNVDGKITFAPIQADRVGLFTYYLREELPAEAQGAVLDNIRYDTTLWKAEVNVGRNAQNQRLEATITYSRQNADGSWTPVPEGATFTNRYLPAFRTQYSPVVRKTFTSDSQARPQEQSFTFTLTPAESYGEAARIDQGGDRVTLTHEGVAYFAPITFTQTGTYRFTLQEVNDGKAGYTYDTTQWTLEIEVGKQDDALKVLHAVYRAEGKPSAGMATFVNGYYPPSDPPETPDEENGDGGGGGGTNPEPTQPAAPANPLQVLQQWVRSLLPQTGDDSQPLLWVVLLVVSAGCLAGIVIWRKRKK